MPLASVYRAFTGLLYNRGIVYHARQARAYRGILEAYRGIG
jgi:hypothetical protein